MDRARSDSACPCFGKVASRAVPLVQPPRRVPTDRRMHADYLRLLLRTCKSSPARIVGGRYYTGGGYGAPKDLLRGRIGRIGFHHPSPRIMSFYAVINISMLAGSYPPIYFVNANWPSPIPDLASGRVHPIDRIDPGQQSLRR